MHILVSDHGYRIEDIENMTPYELEMVFAIILKVNEQKKDMMKNRGG